MRVGVPKEIKSHEQRVGLTPASVREVVEAGHDVLVQSGAGRGIGADDDTYKSAGAAIVPHAEDVFAHAELIVKVKEPQACERAMLRSDHLLFAYLHLAADPEQARDLLASGATCIAYETVTDAANGLPLLAPMSQIAGRMSIQAGASSLESIRGGAGLLLGGVPGVAPARVVIIGGGVVGRHAAEMAIGLGANVTVLDKRLEALDELHARFGARVTTLYSTRAALESEVLGADLVVAAVLVKGARAPRLVSAKTINGMRPGSAIVDVSIDQGGAFETSRPTSHQNPTYVVEQVVHYCVANMPGGVPRTATEALNHATLPFVVRLADDPRGALVDSPHIRNGLNVFDGRVTEPAVADSLDLEYTPPLDVLAST